MGTYIPPLAALAMAILVWNGLHLLFSRLCSHGNRLRAFAGQFSLHTSACICFLFQALVQATWSAAFTGVYAACGSYLAFGSFIMYMQMDIPLLVRSLVNVFMQMDIPSLLSQQYFVHVVRNCLLMGEEPCRGYVCSGVNAIIFSMVVVTFSSLLKFLGK